MSIDEMIATIDSWVIQIEERIQPFARKELFEKEKQIIAALKAGQVMRQAFSTEEYYDVAGNKREELDVDMEEAEEAVKTWDAAIREDV